jgi:hypothetical protein
MSNSIVQAILFKKNDWDLQNSMKWLENNHFKAKKVDITNNWFRYRLLEPIDLKNRGYTSYANKLIEDEGILLVIAYK